MPEKIIRELLDRYGALSFDGLLSFMNLNANELSNEIAKLEKNGDLVKVKKRYFLVDGKAFIKGEIQIKKGNIGFLRGVDQDIFIPTDGLESASDKDIVVIQVREGFVGPGQLPEGKVIKVVKRGITSLVARMTDKRFKGYTVFVSVDPNVQVSSIPVHNDTLKGSVLGSICLLHIEHKGGELYGKVDRIIGHETDPGIDILAIVIANDLRYKFKAEVMREVDDVPTEVDPKDLVGRTDFTTEKVITIDGLDAKDLDDAVHVKRLVNGNIELGVHIADVAHYVKEGTEIDKEAYARGTSVYLADRVIPMLPRKLSNGICSLNPQVLRLTLSCVMEINNKGKVVDFKIVKGFIKTTYRMDYDTVNQILLEKDAVLIERYRNIYDMLLDMHILSKQLREARQARGAIEFEVPEMEIEIVNDEVVNIQARERKDAEMLIEDFMLVANETVAEHLYHLHYPCIYRVHDKPDAKKFSAFLNTLEAAGHGISMRKEIHPRVLQKILEQVHGLPEGQALNSLMLRTMAKAKYSEENLGHYGLAAKFYCHFTSPIRRYPDTLVHRILHDLILDQNPNFQKKFSALQSFLPQAAEHTSLCERKAIETERAVNDLKAAEYMQKFIGEEFEGIVSSITSFGFFVMLQSTVEGLVHITSLPDYFKFYPNIPSLVGERTKEVYNVGDKVIVRVLEANKETRKIDFEIVKHEERPKKKAR